MKNLKIIFILELIYALHLFINYSGFNPYGLASAFLELLVPENISVCIFLPIFFIVTAHILIFQKNFYSNKEYNLLKKTCLIILYVNIFFTILWVYNVQRQINKGYLIVNKIEEYKRVNNEYPENIDSIFAALKINKKINEYTYYKTAPLLYHFSVQPEEFGWDHYDYDPKEKKFKLVID